jgi:hypothetical protein
VKNRTNSFQIGILSNESFITSLQIYLKNKLNTNDIYKHKKGKSYNLHIGNTAVCLKFKEYLYDNSEIYLIRKKLIFDKINNSL